MKETPFVFICLYFYPRFILPSHACHHHTNIILAMWCPITGSHKNWPCAAAEDNAPCPGGGVLFYLIYLIFVYFYFILTGRLKGFPHGKDAVKGGDNDVCPHAEGHTNSYTCADTHIIMCNALNIRAWIFFFSLFFFFLLLARWAQWCSNPRTKTTVTTILLTGLCRTIRWELRVTALALEDGTHTYNHTART